MLGTGKFGSEIQKEEYLNPLASGKMLGAFCLSEPEAGSDAVNQRTRQPAKETGTCLMAQRIS